MRSVAYCAAVGLLSSGCIPLVTGPNNFTPAGEIGAHPYSVGVAVEASRPLTDGTKIARGDVAGGSLWLSEDANLRVGISNKLALEGQIKAASFSPVPIPVPIGASLGARQTFFKQSEDPISLDAVARLLAVSTDVKSGTTRLKAASYGLEVQVPVSYRAASWFAATLTPFTRLHYLSATASDSAVADSTQSESGIAWGTGLSLSVELKLSVIALAPAIALEAVRVPSGELVLSQIEPGLWLGARW